MRIVKEGGSAERVRNMVAGWKKDEIVDLEVSLDSNDAMFLCYRDEGEASFLQKMGLQVYAGSLTTTGYGR
eukprot:CAMPEP_0203936358 /NCGR_PEP_ID=MMETSP0359-20131031/73922_1 /ASSEMBLY_ACC=CAM_ASM_000338 /TAXON_ID=268821 /ORGANISM="Scrippsiella Hangoei, Strain SHTV-5" /LENGTH=70 /DNA_ID=CAMNT_0050866333 /DNA_START=1 /DNA_END=209 /DNA_ORIENTATION=-